MALVIGLFLFSTNYFFFYTGALVLPRLLAVVFASASLINLFASAAVFRTRSPRWVWWFSAGLCWHPAVLAKIAGQWSAFRRGPHTRCSALAALGLCILGTLSFCSGNMVSTAAQRRDLPAVGSTACSTALH